jgi:hypothetical protein
LKKRLTRSIIFVSTKATSKEHATNPKLLTRRITFASTALILLSMTFAVRAQEKDYEPFPNPVTGRTAPAFSMQGIYGETYTSRDIKDSPAVLIFGTSW